MTAVATGRERRGGRLPRLALALLLAVPATGLHLAAPAAAGSPVPPAAAVGDGTAQEDAAQEDAAQEDAAQEDAAQEDAAQEDAVSPPGEGPTSSTTPEETPEQAAPEAAPREPGATEPEQDVPGPAEPGAGATGPPPAPALDGPAGPGSGRSPAFRVSPVAGAVVRCRVVADGEVVETRDPCGGDVVLRLPEDRTTGTWTLEAVAVDEAGVSSDVASRTYELDTVAPARPALRVPAEVSRRDVLVELPDVTEPGLRCVVRLAGQQGEDEPTACEGTRSLVLPPDEGVHAVQAQAYDAAGNASPLAVAQVRLRTTPPPAPLLRAPQEAVSRGLDVGWGLEAADDLRADDADPGRTVTSCRLVPPAGEPTTWEACADVASRPLRATDAPSDGTWVLEARAEAPGGATSGTSAVAHVVDTVAPAAPELAAPAPGALDPRTPSWGLVLPEEPATLSCSVRVQRTPDGPVEAVEGTADARCAAPEVAVDLHGGGDGTFWLQVDAADEAGNVSTAVSPPHVVRTEAGRAEPGDSKVRRDVLGPPAVALTPAAGGTLATDDRPVVRVQAPGGGVRLLCRATLPDGTTERLGCSPRGVVRALDLSGQPDGTVRVEAVAVDAAGETGPAGSVAFLRDTTPPAAPVATSSLPGKGDDPTPTWTFSVPDGASAQCRVREQGAAWTPCSGSFTADLTDSEPGAGGAWHLEVRAVDASGLAGPPLVVRHRVVPARPDRPALRPVGTPDARASSVRWAVAQDGAQGAVLECRAFAPGSTGRRDLATSPGEAAGPWLPCDEPTLDLRGAPDGTHVLEVRRVLGGRASLVSVVTHLRDTTPPAAPRALVVPASPSPDLAPVLQVAAPPDAAVLECRGDARGRPRWARCGESVTLQLATRADGTRTVAVRGVDASGNAGPALRVYHELDRGAPPTPAVSLELGTDGATTGRLAVQSPPGTSVLCRVVAPDVQDGVAEGCEDRWRPELPAATDAPARAEVAVVAADGTPGPAAVVDLHGLAPGGTAPAPELLDPQPSPTRQDVLFWRWSADGPATCRVLLPGRSGPTAPQPCRDAFVVDVGDVPQGTVTLEVTPVARPGVAVPPLRSSAERWTGEVRAPGITAPPAAQAKSGPSSRPVDPFRLDVSAPSGVDVRCSLSSRGVVLEDDVACSGGYVTARRADLERAAFALRAVAVDATGARSPGVTYRSGPLSGPGGLPGGGDDRGPGAGGGSPPRPDGPARPDVPPGPEVPARPDVPQGADVPQGPEVPPGAEVAAGTDPQPAPGAPGGARLPADRPGAAGQDVPGAGLRGPGQGGAGAQEPQRGPALGGAGPPSGPGVPERAAEALAEAAQDVLSVPTDPQEAGAAALSIIQDVRLDDAEQLLRPTPSHLGLGALAVLVFLLVNARLDRRDPRLVDGGAGRRADLVEFEDPEEDR